MIVAIMTTALSGTVWGQSTATLQITSSVTSQGNLTDDGSNSWAFTTDGELTANKSYIQAGTNSKKVSYIRLTTSAFSSKKITKVQVWGTSKANTSVSAKVIIGTTTIGTSSVYTSQTASSGGTEFSVNNTDEVTGDLTIEISRASSATGAIYFNKAIVTYVDGSSSAVATTTTIDDSGITNTDVYAGTAAGSLSATVKDNNNATITGATVTWSSSNENVATVASNGTVTLVAAGTTNITASYAGVANQYLSSASDAYVLTVTDSTPFAGGDVTFVAGTDKGTTTTNADGDEVSKSDVTISSTKAAFATSEYRFYQDSETTISTSQGTITSIVFTQSGNYAVSNFSANVGSYNDGTWTGNASSVTFIASAQVRASQVVVTVDMSATPDPVINADNVNIAYNDEDGEIAYTISYSVSGGSIVASETASWLEVDDVAQSTTTGTIEFICDPNSETTARSAEVTLTYTYNTNETVTKTVTITQAANPNISTIPALFDAATSTESEVLVTFDNWVVSGVSTNGKNVFVTDNAGNGFVIYSSSDQSSTYAVGNILSGTAVTCGLKKYNGFAELLNVDASDLTITTGGTVTAANVAMADLAGVNTGALVSYENLTCSVSDGKYYLSDGTTTLQVYNTLYAFEALEADKTYNITGIYEQFNNTKEILPRSAADIEEVTNTIAVTGVSLDESSLTMEIGDTETLTATVTPANATNKTVTWSSDDTDVATVANGVVTAVSAGTCTITVTTNDGSFTATCDVTVNSAASSSSDATITFDFTDTAWGFPADYTTSEESYTNSSYTFTVGAVTTGGHKAMTTGSGATLKQTALIFGKEAGATLTFPAFPFNVSKIVVNGPASGASGKVTQNIFVGDVAVSTETTGANGTLTYDINENYQTAGNVYVLKLTNANNSQICSIEVFGYESVTVTDAGYATFASDNALDFTSLSIKAFYATESAGTLSFTQVNKVPAGTGVLLYAAGGATVDVPVFTGAADGVTNNVFVRGEGTPVSYSETNQNYILFNGEDGIGFYKANNNNVATNRAYIHVTSSNNVKSFVINLEDDATGISLMEDGRSQMEDGVIYNLAGQRLDNSQFTIHNSQLKRGIYIVNGKKILK